MSTPARPLAEVLAEHVAEVQANRLEGTFLVGLPVVVTIDADGTVTLAVCPEDADTAIADEDATDAQVAAVGAALTARTFKVAST